MPSIPTANAICEGFEDRSARNEVGIRLPDAGSNCMNAIAQKTALSAAAARAVQRAGAPKPMAAAAAWGLG
ncbi:MAG: hypothetical protein R3F11_24395 [Verrucomicrobiales bacterium]